MPSYRLLNSEGRTIGAVIIDKPEQEAEIVNTLPELRLDYTTTVSEILSFTLVVVPPEIGNG